MIYSTLLNEKKPIHDHSKSIQCDSVGSVVNLDKVKCYIMFILL